MFASYKRDLDVVAETDVLVCGAGCAGVVAAVAAARMGVRTMAIEQWPFAGGNITGASVNGCCGLADMTTGELAVGGIVLELLERNGQIRLPLPSTKLFEPYLGKDGIARRHTKLPYSWDTERFKVDADRMLQESGVQLLYHTKIADVVTAGSRIDYIVLANKSGVTAVRAKMYIDCTGDGDVAAWAGVPFDIDPSPQPMTLEFYATNVAVPEDRQSIVDKCAVVLKDAHAAGRMGVYAGPWMSFPAPNMLRFNAIRLAFDSTSPTELTHADIRGREDAWRMFELWNENLPEFREAFFAFSGPAAGARESRRIRGQYTLTKEDILATRTFEDTVVKGAWYLDRHPPGTPGYHSHGLIKAYPIPYRTLVPVGIDNLLVAGRCHSATAEALASSRVGVTAMGMGQAAGVAAALALEHGACGGSVDVAALRGILRSQGAILD